MLGWVSSPSYGVVARIVRDARVRAGLSQRELAKRLGKPPSFVANLETRQRRLDVVEFITLMRALGADEAAAFEELRAAMPPDAEGI